MSLWQLDPRAAATDVWFRYGRRTSPWMLQDVDARAARRARSRSCSGRNGAGKSTLLQLAAGVLRPGRGAVRDRPTVVGWVPERFPADQPFTARSYLTRMAAIRGRSAPESDRALGRPPATATALPRRPLSATCPRAPRRRSAWSRRCWSRPACSSSTSRGRAWTRRPASRYRRSSPRSSRPAARYWSATTAARSPGCPARPIWRVERGPACIRRARPTATADGASSRSRYARGARRRRAIARLRADGHRRRPASGRRRGR